MKVLAYFITFSCYGSHISGQEGCIDRKRNAFGSRPPDPNRAKEKWIRSRMATEAHIITGERRPIVLESIKSVCQFRGWYLYAAHVRTNHVHVVTSADTTPEKLLNTLKSYCSRALNVHEGEVRPRWTRHGSTRYLWTREAVEDSIAYVVSHQGEPLSLFQSRHA
jgi:REP element-mobilizing transposase RayT